MTSGAVPLTADKLNNLCFEILKPEAQIIFKIFYYINEEVVDPCNTRNSSRCRIIISHEEKGKVHSTDHVPGQA
jgi:hypothetical protein